MDCNKMQKDKDQFRRSSVLGGVPTFVSASWTFLEFGQMDESNGLDFTKFFGRASFSVS